MERGALYKIRWEILVMAVSLILIAIVVYAIPSDYVLKLLREREQEFNARQSTGGSIVGEILQGSDQGVNTNIP